jgi:hypothetical protein
MTYEMNDREMERLRSELEEFKREKERIRTFVGQIGGKDTSRRDKLLNRAFITLLILLFAADILRHGFKMYIPMMPAMLSLEFGVLLVSVKIIWMIHKQTKVEHFQFWILNSIEFRLNEVSKKINRIEKLVKEKNQTANN